MHLYWRILRDRDSLYSMYELILIADKQSLQAHCCGIAGTDTSCFLVTISLSLNITTIQFTAVQHKFQESMALAAGMSEADWGRVAIVLQSVRRRMLLAAAVGADLTINLPNASSAASALNLLTETNINKVLASQNLPTAKVTTRAALESSSPASGTQAVSSSSSTNVAIGVGVGLGCSLIVAAILTSFFCWRNQVRWHFHVHLWKLFNNISSCSALFAQNQHANKRKVTVQQHSQYVNAVSVFFDLRASRFLSPGCAQSIHIYTQPTSY